MDAGTVARKADFRSYVTASGEIVATRFADIGSNVMGRIVSLPVKEGEEVEAGQLLAQIDPVPARSDLDAAEALVRALQADARAATEQVATATADAEQAKARAQEANQTLTRARAAAQAGTLAAVRSRRRAGGRRRRQRAGAVHHVRGRARGRGAGRRRAPRHAGARRRPPAPATSCRRRRSRRPSTAWSRGCRCDRARWSSSGSRTSPGTTLMTISDLSGINAEVKVAEADVLRVKLDQPARVTLEALPDRPFDRPRHRDRRVGAADDRRRRRRARVPRGRSGSITPARRCVPASRATPRSSPARRRTSSPSRSRPSSCGAPAPRAPATSAPSSAACSPSSAGSSASCR